MTETIIDMLDEAKREKDAMRQMDMALTHIEYGVKDIIRLNRMFPDLPMGPEFWSSVRLHSDRLNAEIKVSVKDNDDGI